MTARSERSRILYEAIGRSIRAARQAQGLAPSALAASMGLFPASLSRAEHGRQHFTVEAIYRYADALGIDPRDLLP